MCTVDGQLFQAGDAQERFSIQSISKVLSLCCRHASLLRRGNLATRRQRSV
ncbi:glutaminase [Escherichia coli]